MSSVTYAIVFNGQIVDGFQAISVKAHMAKLLKLDAEKMAILFSGKQVVIKRTPDKEQAVKYGTALKKIGADIKVKVIKSDAPAKPAPAPKAAATATNATASSATAAQGTETGLTLLPNEGNLFDPKPEVPAPQIDLSGIELAANDGSPLVEPKPHEEVELDLSEYSVSDVGDAPLAEPSPEAPKIEAPDFGLDEPGATLETLQEDVQPVNPDISSLTLADAGEDLLKPEEKRSATPEPEAPDTSNIHLVPNFD